MAAGNAARALVNEKWPDVIDQRRRRPCSDAVDSHVVWLDFDRFQTSKLTLSQEDHKLGCSLTNSRISRPTVRCQRLTVSLGRSLARCRLLGILVFLKYPQEASNLIKFIERFKRPTDFLKLDSPCTPVVVGLPRHAPFLLPPSQYYCNSRV